MKPSVVDLGFLAARAHLLDLAAFLDRADRAGEHGDPRVAALRQALIHLGGAEPERARKILETLSDPTVEPTDRAGPPACGAWTGEC